MITTIKRQIATQKPPVVAFSFNEMARLVSAVSGVGASQYAVQRERALVRSFVRKTRTSYTLVCKVGLIDWQAGRLG